MQHSIFLLSSRNHLHSSCRYASSSRFFTFGLLSLSLFPSLNHDKSLCRFLAKHSTSFPPLIFVSLMYLWSFLLAHLSSSPLSLSSFLSPPRLFRWSRVLFKGKVNVLVLPGQIFCSTHAQAVPYQVYFRKWKFTNVSLSKCFVSFVVQWKVGKRLDRFLKNVYWWLVIFWILEICIQRNLSIVLSISLSVSDVAATCMHVILQ